jgi:hypothetical protein
MYQRKTKPEREGNKKEKGPTKQEEKVNVFDTFFILIMRMALGETTRHRQLTNAFDVDVLGCSEN